MYYELTPDQRQLYVDQRNSGGSAFVYRVFSVKAAPAGTDGVYQDSNMGAPSQIIQSAISMFTNAGTVLCHAGPTYEIDFTGSLQGVKSNMSSFLPEITLYYDKIDSQKFPHTQGLSDLTSCEFKKIQEHISNHTDGKSL